MNEFVIKNGFISKGNSIVEGGITATTISASTYSNLPSPSITVGTSQLTSGTDTRVLFQSGTTLQQDGNFTFDSTLKRLTLKAVGTASTHIPFAVQSSASSSNLFSIRGDQAIEMIATTPSTNGGILITKTDNYNSPRIQLYNVFAQLTDINGSTISTSNLKSGSSGAAGYMGIVNTTSQDRFLKFINLFGQETLSIGGNNYDGAATFTLKSWAGTSPGNIFTIIKSDNTNPFVITDAARVGIGTNSPQSRLDVRAQGALSTDIAFRVRNSADSANIIEQRGDGNLVLNGAPARMTYSSANHTGSISHHSRADSVVNLKHSFTFFQSGFNDGSQSTAPKLNMICANITSYGINNGFHWYFNNNLNPLDSERAMWLTPKKTLSFFSGTGPDAYTSKADSFELYSADVVAGNAAPHFRTENGSIVKLYQETTGVTTSTLISNAGTTITDTDTFDGYTLQQVVKALRNLGVLQ